MLGPLEASLQPAGIFDVGPLLFRIDAHVLDEAVLSLLAAVHETTQIVSLAVIADENGRVRGNESGPSCVFNLDPGGVGNAEQRECKNGGSGERDLHCD